MTYSGAWRTWQLKATEETAEAASAQWLGDPAQSSQHAQEWDTGAHAVDSTAVGRQQLGSGHEWSDAPPPMLQDHAPGVPGYGAGFTTHEGTGAADHGVDWGDPGERRSGGWDRSKSLDPAYTGGDDINYPAARHSTDLGDIAALQRRQIRRMQAADEKDLTEDYTFHPGSAGGSVAQLGLARTASAEMNANDGPSHERGAKETGHASAPSVTWADSSHVSHRQRRWVERRIPGVHMWRHDMRPLFWRLAKTAGQTAAGTTHQSSPFPAGPSLSRTTVFTQPLLRRTPPAWDETATSDGSETSGDQGMWGGFGGL